MYETSGFCHSQRRWTLLFCLICIVITVVAVAITIAIHVSKGENPDSGIPFSSVDGGWSKWSYGQCSKTCGGGIKRRTRTCTEPAPEHGGNDCVGEDSTDLTCNTDTCPPSDRCRTGWMEFDMRCYYVATEKKNTSWEASEEECRNLDPRAHLPSIGSQREQDFIAKYANDTYILLGATDKDLEGNWKWTDGRPLNYTNWANNEPNNRNYTGGTEDCAEMNPSNPLVEQNKWNDLRCYKYYDNEFRLMCSYPTCCQPLVKSDYIVDYIGEYNYLKNVNGRPVYSRKGNESEWCLFYSQLWKVHKCSHLNTDPENDPGRMYINNTAYCPNDLGRWEGWAIEIKEVGSVTCVGSDAAEDRK